ncbi:hypothetical protein F442_21324 [Phytophthora nicotianae P10297]|uniref:Ubiquitin-like protease family profile domain-containing protein n=1 Tax=Phytophthora nicotianae P10297 TaxID=1317064 RepID=W2Y4J0_PHYNI|nr:hypothetical protein F442_21324 [Phytophthora nicotianae P10297]
MMLQCATDLYYINVKMLALELWPNFQQLPEEQVKVAPQANPFQEGNDVILIPMHVDGNHWCGIVIDFRAESRGITIFDPSQEKTGKYYDVCKAKLMEQYGELYHLLHVKKETKSRQPDMASCGVAVLMFFECKIRGITLLPKPSVAFMRFMRSRYLLKCTL